MEVIAKSKYIRLSQKKLNLVAGAIRGLPVAEAEKILTYLSKRGSRFLNSFLFGFFLYLVFHERYEHGFHAVWIDTHCLSVLDNLNRHDISCF